MTDITITPGGGGGDLTLPGDMRWTDEWTWSPRAKEVDRGLGGALIVHAGERLDGRPITLQTGVGNLGPFGAVHRSAVKALRALEEAGEVTHTLTLADGRAFQVRFRQQDGPGVEAAPLRFKAPEADEDWYSVTVRFMEV